MGNLNKKKNTKNACNRFTNPKGYAIIYRHFNSEFALSMQIVGLKIKNLTEIF